MKEVRPLHKFITLKDGSDPRLAQLIAKVFGKFVLVQNYQLAMQIAKDYNLTCITPDH
jgi:23S rRNA G2069 N7-methylase RlmK/C1962 C5-methylase RlmI